MSTQFETGFENDDIIEADHVKQFAEPIQDLESGVALYREDIGTGDAYKVNFFDDSESENMIAAYSPGLVVYLKAATANTGPATLTIHGSDGDDPPAATDLDPIPLVKNGAEPLEDGDISAGQVVAAIYTDDVTDGPRFQVMGSGGGAGALAELEGVALSSLANGDVLQYDGTDFVNRTPSAAGLVQQSRTISTTAPLSGGGDLSANRTLSMAQASASVDGFLDSADFATFAGKQDTLTAPGDVPGLTTALAGKANATHTHAATEIGGGTVSNTEFGYLDGVTSSVQAQLDGKAASSHTHAQSDITNLTTDLGNKQPLDADLTEIATLSNVRGDLLVTNSTPEWTRLPKGSANQALRMDSGGNDPAWGTLAPGGGGTGQSTYATGDTLYASGSNVLAKRTIGSTGDILTVAGGVPTWAVPATPTLGYCRRRSLTGITSGYIQFSTSGSDIVKSDSGYVTSTADRITVPATGTYLVLAGYRGVQTLSNSHVFSIRIVTTSVSNYNWYNADSSQEASGFTGTIVDITSGDYVRLSMVVGSGTMSNPADVWLSVVRLK